MEILAEGLELKCKKDTAIAIGKFDGIHVGHQRLLQEILKAKRAGLAACVFTFDKSPAALFGKGDGKVLSTPEEKRRCFESLGVDILVEFPLTRESAGIPAREFAKSYLAGALRGKFVAAGEDLSFGDKGLGNARLLREMSGELGLEIVTIPKVRVGDQEVSSTGIRSLIEEGRMEEAGQMLGAPYSFTGTVCHGRALGRTLGFPTVNLYPEEDKLLPPFGVYYSLVRVGDREYHGITNVGCKPTVSGKERPGIETHLYDFQGDLYDRELKVGLLHFSRPEQKFAGLEELKRQLERDIHGGSAYFRQIATDS